MGPRKGSPLSLIVRGFLANKPRKINGSKKYPMDRITPQSCTRCLPPITMPGLYFSLVPATHTPNQINKNIIVIVYYTSLNNTHITIFPSMGNKGYNYGGNMKILPVSLISTTQSSESFSNKRRRETSWGRRPGKVSSARISSIRTGLAERVANKSLCLRFWLPFSFLYVVFPISLLLSLLPTFLKRTTRKHYIVSQS